MERRCKNRKPAVEPRCAVNDLPDDLLRLMILLRLDSPLWLVRAASACKTWRRVVTGDGGGDQGRAFLRLARSLHPPVVAGHYLNCGGTSHRFLPSSPTPTISLSLDFFLPQETVRRHSTLIKHWHVADAHGGLLLLLGGSDRVSDSDLVVCDPLSRHYRCIHHPPDQVFLPDGDYDYMPRVFLLDGGDDDGNVSISDFRVLYYSDDHDGFSKVYAFSTADGGGWLLVRQALDDDDDDNDDDDDLYLGQVVGRIDRSLYMASSAGILKVLDNAGSLEFSEVDLPIRKSGSRYRRQRSTFAVVHGASPEPTTSPATASIVHVRGEDLELFRRNPSSGEWVLAHSIPRLSKATRGLQGYPERSRWRTVVVVASGTRLAVLEVSLSRRVRGQKWSWFFSLDVDTMQLQVVADMDAATYITPDMEPVIYTLPWPHFLTALPS